MHLYVLMYIQETHVFHVFVAVFCQALFRYALVKLYMRYEDDSLFVYFGKMGHITEFLICRVESRLPALLPKDSFAQLSDASSSIACGVGFGLAHSLIMYGAIISQAGGVETVLVSDCTNLSIFDISGNKRGTPRTKNMLFYQFNLFALAAGSAFLVNVLHLGLMIWAFDAYRKTGWKSYMRWMFLIAVHLTYSLIVRLIRLDFSHYSLPQRLPLVLLYVYSHWHMAQAHV